MQLCVNCLGVAGPKSEQCPSCGGAAFAKLSRRGHVVVLPEAAHVPCQGCFEERALKFRGYRRVTSYLFGATVRTSAGYFCSRCRLRMFLKHQGLTLLLGWWGMLSFAIYNPFALLVNFWALFAAPLNAGSRGAMHVDALLADAAKEERLADIYMRLPSWFDQLSEEDLTRVASGKDHYATLHLSSDASEAEIKAAYREMAKRYHPDAGREIPQAHDIMVEINEAYAVLGDPRLRHAYDNIDELAPLFAPAGADAPTGGQANGNGHAPTGRRAGWRCKTCGELFDDYEEARDHAERRHPDRITIDPRQAVERAEP